MMSRETTNGFSDIIARRYEGSGAVHFYGVDEQGYLRPVKKSVLEQEGHTVADIAVSTMPLPIANKKRTLPASNEPEPSITLPLAPTPLIATPPPPAPQPTSAVRLDFADEATAELDNNRERFAELLARRQRVGLIAIKATRRRVRQAEKQYVQHFGALLDNEFERRSAAGTEGVTLEQTMQAATEEEFDELLARVCRQRLTLARERRLNFFYEWWAAQEPGRKGTLKKVGMLALAGAGTGLVASFVAGTMGVGAFGAGAAAGLARGVARNLARQKLDGATSETTVAEKQLEYQQLEIRRKSEQHWRQEGQALPAEDLSALVTGVVEHSVRRNRKRILGAIAVGAATGLTMGVIGSYVHNGFFSKPAVINEPFPSHPPLPTSPLPHSLLVPPSISQLPSLPALPTHGVAPIAPTMPAAGITDGFRDSVFVETAHGYTSELADLATQKGVSLNGAQAWNAYLAVKAQVGGNFFVNDPSYIISGNNLGISRPGAAAWNPAAVHAFELWLQQNSLVAPTSS